MKPTRASNSRVRWTREEADAFVRRAAEVRTTQPDWTARKIVEKAQDVLSPARRRPVYPPLVSWTNKALSKIDSRAARRAPSAPAAEPPDAPAPSAHGTERETPTSGGDDALVAALVQYGIRAGSAVVTGILRDPAVQASVASLMADVIRQLSRSLAVPGSAAPEADIDTSVVLVVGLTDQQAMEFARAYQGLLQIEFAKGDSASTALRTEIARASLVIAMDGTISSEVHRMLQQVAPGYIRHTNGLSGLRTRLANLAMESGAQMGDAATGSGATGRPS